MIASSRRARLSIGSACTLAAGLACLVSAASTPAAPRTSSTRAPVSPADAAATRAYLEAVYRLDSTLVTNAGASRAAATAFADKLGHECHGVLAGEPKEGSPQSEAPTTPRARGELRRSDVQERTIEEELSLATIAATYKPDQAAIEAYVAAVAPLRWSNPEIRPPVRYSAGSPNERFRWLLPAEVCADMETWAHSGYHVLSAGSRELQAEQLAQSETQAAESEANGPSAPIETLLKPYEDAADRQLVRRLATLRSKLKAVGFGISRAFASLPHAVGEPEDFLEERESEPVLARGSTSAGTTFVVRARAGGGELEPSCKHPVSIWFEERRKGAKGLISSGFGGLVCLGAHPEGPSGSCGNGIESITAVVPAAVRTVHLHLSDGRTITSSVVRVPRKYGGHEGIYVQAVRFRSAYPVSLAELDARGHVVKVLGLKAIRCQTEPTTKVEGPKFVQLVHGSTPSGKPFVIEGTLVHFGRGQTSFSLSVSSRLESLRNGSEQEGAISVGSPESAPKAYSWSLGLECPPHEVAIVYGILNAPGASVLARTPDGLVPLTLVALAPDLHAGGPLAYGVFTSMPSELIVRRKDGSTVYTESLAARAKEEAEFCEGYAEA